MLNSKELRYCQASMTNLSIKHDDSYNSSWNAAVTSERFLRAASFLPDGEFLGWQIDTKTFSNTAFSSLGTKVTMEDFNWIFHQCAAASPLTSEWMEDLNMENRKVYMLSPVAGSTRDVDIPEQRTFDLSEGDCDERLFKYLLCDMFEIMAETGAVIRIIAGGATEKTKGHGMFLISLSGEITLRMRGMLSIAFPHLVVDEVDKLPEETDEMECLPDDCFLESMTRMLSALVRLKADKKLADEIEPDDAEEIKDEIEDDFDDDIDLDDSMLDDAFENDTNDEETGDNTDIDELGLSVHSYLCLKRAGIDTVEELQKLSDNELMDIRNLRKNDVKEIKQKLAGIQSLTKAIPLQETNYMARLDELIGLSDVKEQVRKIAALAKMKQDMSENGNTSISVTLNMGFVGKPGTAKTTVARIVAGIFYEIGLLPCNGLIEVGRADLVAKYVGQTAIKVKNIFEKAKGKVLFIDEAYSLVDNWEDGFGDEAINTIVQEMENNRDKTIVIFAGYPDKMESFFSKNPGLRSRVPFTINFNDYSVEEMVKIAELEAKNRGFSIGTEAYEKVITICSEAVLRPDMGNGRFCRNLIENAILGYATRIYGNDDGDADKNCILATEDFTSPIVMNDIKKIPIGFYA